MNSSNILRITLLAGLILFILTGGVLTVFYLMERSSTKMTRIQDSFHNLLREYDELANENYGTEREFERLNRKLDKMEKRTISVESWLSVLKRRREIVRLHPPSAANYRAGIERALKVYPASQPLLALAAEALAANTAINSISEATLRGLLLQLTDSSFNNLRLGFHVLLGDFKDPARAALLPSDISSDGTDSITVDFAILKILRDDIRGAAADIQTILISPSVSSVNTLRFAAEYYYDFGDLRRSAEIFSFIHDEKALIRQADALYLAGFHDSARSIWRVLADSPYEHEILLSQRSLYNLAVTTEAPEESAAYFKKLVELNTAATDSRQFGLIRYTRLLPDTQAVTLLEKTEGLNPADYPFIDLEICKRQASAWRLERQFAETWLLLDRHPENEDLYQWACRMFLFQRDYNEAKILLNRMRQPEWTKIYRAIQLMAEGDIETAEEILRSIPSGGREWPVYANLGRILEAQRSTARALEQYELAFGKTENPKAASRIQHRIAKCHTAMGRTSDAILALMYAVELDPDNLAARLELDRLTLL
jgi:tetratricopeptide (TPR) repeat protein